MLKIFDKYKNTLKEYLYPLALIIIYAVFISLSFGKWGHIFYDCFREAVIPNALLDGKILYKDILNLYPPLAYQINASLYFVFGSSLNTLYWAGIINSALILSIIYFIVKKFSSSLTAFIIVISIMEIFTFKIPFVVASWIFPYSYSFIYAFSSVLFGLLFYVLYKENPFKTRFLLLSILFSGLSFAFKFDFILFILLPLYDLIKTKNLKLCLYGVFAFFSPIVLSILIFLLFGGSFDILKDEINFLISFSKAPSVVLYNREIMPQTFNLHILSDVFISFKRFLFSAAILFLYTYFSTFLILKIKNKALKILSGGVLYVFGYSIIIILINLFQFSQFSVYGDLAYVSYFVTITGIVILLIKFKNKIPFKDFSRKEKFYLSGLVFALLISFRSFGILYTSFIGNFIIAIWWALFVYVFLEIIPIKKDTLKKTLSLFFIAYGLLFWFLYSLNGARTNYPVKSDKGTYMVSKEYAFAINEGLNFINDNIEKDKTLLVLEEGLIFNYFSNRKTNLKYYALIPHMIDTYGEDNIIKGLNQNMPDYIFITNDKYITELGGYFGTDYGKKIYEFILKNYDYIKTIKDEDLNAENNLEVRIFKVK